MWRRRTVALVLAVVAGLVASCGGGDRSTPSTTPLPAPPRPELAVDVRTEAFVDQSRRTEAVGTSPPSDVRTLSTRIFAPGTGQPGRPYPLIVFAHGSGGLGTGYDQLLRTWASAGYVVVAPAFPFGVSEAPQGDPSIDYPNLPGDMSFVVGEVLRLNEDAGSPLAGAVDPVRIGAAGHSLGGMTTLALAGNTCCHDARIKAAAVLAGRETPIGRGQFWNRIITPILLVHGDSDVNVSYADGRRAFANAPPPRFLVTVLGGDHGRPYRADPSDPQARLVTDVVLDFFDHYLKGVADGLVRLQARANTPGLTKLEQER